MLSLTAVGSPGFSSCLTPKGRNKVPSLRSTFMVERGVLCALSHACSSEECQEGMEQVLLFHFCLEHYSVTSKAECILSWGVRARKRGKWLE